MKLVIDIPEQIYLNAKADTLCGADILVKAIKNGTPLDKIRAEIVHLHDWAFSREEVLRIIDKYKAESEKE